MRQRHNILFLNTLFLSIFFIIGCFFPYEAELDSPDNGDFIYCLQSTGYEDLKERDFDFAVLDIDDCGMTSDQLDKLRLDDARILSYLSIGEAEDYRHYWEKDWDIGDPSFLYEENPFWKGNFKVKYWEDQWRTIIYRQLDKIIDTGFDGAYLDLVDAYEYFEAEGYLSAKDQMIDFVNSISIYAKSRQEGFLIIPQNAEELIDNKIYLYSIDGLGKENLMFLNGTSIEPQTQKKALEYLKRAKESGKYVFLISYVDDKDKITRLVDVAMSNDFYYFIGRKELDTPDCISLYY